MFAIVFGLSMDYEVFLLTRVREAWGRTRDNAVSVAEGLAATARVISCAALIITCVFLAFLLSTDVVVKMLALGLGVSIIVDATLIRLLVVPATMFLLGKANWWTPRWLTRLPDLLEPVALPVQAAAVQGTSITPAANADMPVPNADVSRRSATMLPAPAQDAPARDPQAQDARIPDTTTLEARRRTGR
jgi:RND superfamily putative drug exporter